VSQVLSIYMGGAGGGVLGKCQRQSKDNKAKEKRKPRRARNL